MPCFIVRANVIDSDSIFVIIDTYIHHSGIVKHKNWGLKQMNFFHRGLPYTSSNMHLCFYWIHFTSTIYFTTFAVKCLDMTLLIHLFTALCRILKYAVSHILFKRYKHRSLWRIDFPWWQAGYFFVTRV